MKKQKKKKEVVRQAVQTPSMHPLNWAILGVALILIALGFFSLSRGSVTLAPILLVLGYCVAVPLALLLRFGPRQEKKDAGNV